MVYRPASTTLFRWELSGANQKVGRSFDYLFPVILEMYINGKLVDSTVLSIRQIYDPAERELYIQGAVNHLLEEWNDLIEDQNLKPQFFIKGQFSFR